MPNNILHFLIYLTTLFLLFFSPLQEARSVSTRGGEFVDKYNRTLFYRGINLGGSSKIPFSSNCENKTSLCADVSFIGRPFPIEQADIHFSRLQSWGYNFVRLIVTWEALEHLGPGQYDEEYIAYIKQIIIKANDYGFTILIDAHQDVWSRFTGGDGAPLWTLEVAGFDLTGFRDTNAALIYNDPGEKIPPMIWPTNYSKLASATMFSLFFGGNDFAPKTLIGNIAIQDFLQQSYIAAFVRLAEEIEPLQNVVGFEVMNEPHPGWIGQKSLSEYTRFPLRNQATPTPAQAMALGAGYSVKVASWKVGMLGLEQDGIIEINDQHVTTWSANSQDIWLSEGVWRDNDGEFELLRDDYFFKIKGKKVNFSQDYYAPFIRSFSKAIRQVMPKALIFIEKPFNSSMPELKDLENTVNATHWYDQITLIKKIYLSWASLNLSTGDPILGESAIDEHFEKQLAGIIKLSEKLHPDSPTLVGEFGVPFDLSDGDAFDRNLLGNWDFSQQELALDRSFRAMENNHANYALWNYTASNSNLLGDNWNGEDLSIFSLSQTSTDKEENIDNGGRALRAVIRPFASVVNGLVNSTSFNMQTGSFRLNFSDTSVHKKNLPTVIHLPAFYYLQGHRVELSDGKLVATDNPTVWHYFASKKIHHHNIIITAKKSLSSVGTSIGYKIFIGLIFTTFFLIIVRIRRKRRVLIQK